MRRQREQNGHLYRRGGWWVLRYREIANQGGELKTMQPAEQLFPVDANHKTKKSVRESQEFKDRLRAINERKQVPETVVTLGQFVESTYLPHVREHKRPSTDASYQDVWTLHLKARVDGLLLRDVRTVDVQNWLEAIAVEDRHQTAGLP